MPNPPGWRIVHPPASHGSGRNGQQLLPHLTSGQLHGTVELALPQGLTAQPRSAALTAGARLGLAGQRDDERRNDHCRSGLPGVVSAAPTAPAGRPSVPHSRVEYPRRRWTPGGSPRRLPAARVTIASPLCSAHSPMVEAAAGRSAHRLRQSAARRRNSARSGSFLVSSAARSNSAAASTCRPSCDSSSPRTAGSCG